MNCRICGNENGNRSYFAKDRMLGTGDIFEYIQCANCNCLQIKDIPTDIDKYYPRGYYSLSELPPNNVLIRIALKLRNIYALSHVGFIGKLIYDKYPYPAMRALSRLNLDKDMVNILDVGCGVGKLLNNLRELGFSQKLQGVDPFIESDLHYSNSVCILKKDIQDVDGVWDVVMFHHSFEHLSDPCAVLHKAASLLALNGYCIIRIPTVSSYAWQHYGVNWVQLDPPRHYYLHSITSMRILAQRAGFFVENVIYDSTAFQFWASEQYAKNQPLYDWNSMRISCKEAGYTDKDIRSYTKKAKELNKNGCGDQAVIYLKKDRIDARASIF